MGRSSSSSQANQTTNNALNDSRVTNRDGLVVGAGSTLDMSQVLNTDNSMSLSSWDASSSWADNSLKLSNTSSSNTSTSTHKVDGSYNNSVDSVVTGQAFDFAKGADATLGAGLSSVLSFAKDIATQANEKTSSLASMFGQGVSQAYDSANNTTAGGIDNKTMIVLGVAGAAAVAAIAMNKRG